MRQGSARWALLAASLVHELTQPLAASLANAETASELLAEPVPDIDELRATLTDIVADDRRVGDLIQQLRRFLRRGEGERTELNLRKMIEDVVRFVAGDASSKGIEIVLACAQGLPTFVADRVQIQQVLVNLLLNGFDAVATNEPGSRRIEVLARPFRDGRGCRGDGLRVRHGRDYARPNLSAVLHDQARRNGTRTFDQPDDRGGARRYADRRGRHPVTARRFGSNFRCGRRTSSAPRPPWRSRRRRRGSVSVIDDEPSMRRALHRQLQGAGYRVETFASAQSYLEQPPPTGVACIVSDVRMPGLSGLDLQASLSRAKRELPIVFVSGHGDIHTTVQAMKAGAVSFLPKPFTKGELLAAVADAMVKSRAIETAREENAELRSRYKSLTAREREVFALVVEGLLNKIIADRLGAAETTIKIHRGRVMDKMGATSLPDLVRMGERLNLRFARVEPRLKGSSDSRANTIADHGIMPHSKSLLTMGAATLFRNCFRN